MAVNERDYPSEALLPLRCSLYVSYPILEASASVSGLYVTTYVGMNLKTVDRVRTCTVTLLVYIQACNKVVMIQGMYMCLTTAACTCI